MKWTRMWTRDYGVQYCEAIILSYSEKLKKSKLATAKYNIIYPRKGNIAYYRSFDDTEKMQRIIEQMGEHELEEEIKKLNEFGKKMVDISKEIYNMDLGKKENKKLQELYGIFREVWMDYTVALTSTFYVSENFSKRMQEIISKRKGKHAGHEIKELMEFISSPSEMASINKLNRKITKLKNEGKTVEIENLLKECLWISCLDIHNKPWTEKDIVEYIKNHKIEEEKEFDENEIFERFGFYGDEKKLARLNRRWAYIRDLRDDYRRIGMYYIRKLFEEIGKRMNLGIEKVSFLQGKEIEEFLLFGKTVDPEEIEKRIEGFAMIERDGGIILATGKEMEKLAREIGFEEEILEGDVIEGIGASKGVAKGRAKIVHTIKDLNKIDKGDIMVAITTHPDYIVAMQKASAFVTDEGGLTCHVAIVAREMKKPCIVGTGNATSKIKDGDLIEVDADLGIVKKTNK